VRAKRKGFENGKIHRVGLLTTKSEIFKYTKKWVLLKNNEDGGGVFNDGRSRGLSPTGF
jgi:hypothetical protein